MLDFQSIAAAALMQLTSLVQQWIPGGIFRGDEYVVCNPTRKDDQAGSFSINTRTGAWGDFAIGDKGGDAISLFAYINNVSQADAAKELDKIVGTPKIAPSTPAASPETDWVLVTPVPVDAPPVPDTRPVKTGAGWVRYPLTHRWPYRNQQGIVRFYVVRYQTETGKETPPLTLWRDKSGKLKWRYKSLPAPRPLFNLDRLTNAPGAQVIITEGEKCAECLQTSIDEAGQQAALVAVTWPAGCKSIGKADFSPLRGRKCVLWPDNDKPGRDAMLAIAGILRGLDCSVKIMQIPAGRPEGWDVADFILTDGAGFQQVVDFIRANLTDPPASLPAVPKQKPEKPAGPKPLPLSDDEKFPFKFLGYNGDFYYYLPKGTRQVKAIKGENHGSGTLITIAELSYWERRFQGDRGVNWKLATNELLRMSEKTGVFNPARQRGRGAWFDAGRSVLHTGDYLIVDGKKTQIHEFDSAYIYECGSVLEYTEAKPLSNEQAVKLRDVVDFLFWDRKTSGILLAGWCLTAPICGGLKHRPHLWVTASAGSGKSHIIEYIVKPCLGEFMLPVQSSTTAPGIRQALGSDGLPVLIDEFEGEDPHAQEEIQKILELARQAFSDSSGKIIKGGQFGKAMSYQIRSSFFMSSIGVNISQHADETRISVLPLGVPHDTETRTKAQHFDELNKRINEVLTPAWCAGLRARAIKLIPTIRTNAETFALAVADKLGNRRSGDMIGGLLAGAYALSSTNVIQYEKAREWVERQDWTDQEAITQESDEHRCLDHIMTFPIRVTASEELSVSELLYKVKDGEGFGETPIFEDHDVPEGRFDGALRRHGIRLKDGFIWIASSYPPTKRIMERTPWAKTYGRLLLRMVNSVERTSMRFTGSSCRAIGIPWEEYFT